MRRVFVLFVALFSVASTLKADEGMWLLPQMERVNYSAMKQMGLKLTAEQIYSATRPSIKDAVVIFGGGCTGEIVSPDGLLFTNHHCGFSSIQMLSSIDNDYLKDGFWALDRNGELPVPGLSVKFIRAIVDITPEVLGNVPSISSGEERDKIIGENIKSIINDFNDYKLFIPRITLLFSGGEMDGAESLLSSLEEVRGVDGVRVTLDGEFTVVDIALSPSLSNRNAAKSHNTISQIVASSDIASRLVDLSPLYNDFKSLGNSISIKPFFGGNQYFMFITDSYSDVRLVGAPPQSIGKFGGETDNWMWPRHTGDFSIFRVYAGEDNRPAKYSAKNRPYQSEEYLKISTAGYDIGDFTMILGFPGSTSRYITSYEVDELLEITNPQRIAIREARQDILKERMAQDDKVRIQYASKYATSSNYWKNAIGMSRGLRRLEVKDKKLAEQEAFQAWAVANTLPQEGYIDALSLIKEGKEGSASLYASLQYLSEAAVIAMNFTSIIRGLDPKLVTGVPRKERGEIARGIERLYKDYDAATEREVSVKMLQMMMVNMEHKPALFAEVIEGEFSGDVERYVDYIYDNSHFATQQRATDFVMNFSSRSEFEADPAVKLTSAIYAQMAELSGKIEPFEDMVDEGSRKYIAGRMMQNPDKRFYPDANFTMRLTYGQVLPYSPQDGVLYNHITTLKGVVDKEDVDNPTEFTVEPRLKEIYHSEDYGTYIDKSGVMAVNFLSNNDITGGNSGSPVLNSRGELIGLVFDGNWEAMSGDIAFESELQRSISLDIRYMLLIIDKYAGARWILDELEIVD
ncbi:MAG: S46 family peptidase [Rikenellaceae bacterium]